MTADLPPTDKVDREAVPAGRLEARYLAFLETIAHLRPSLHRYCARMTGSVLDGEDVVQEALFQAYRKLDAFDEGRPLSPWLFRIAHNRCIDFLRRRAIRVQAESAVAEADSTPPLEPVGAALGKAVEHLVVLLPPKERACVLLKDVFDYSLEEIAELVGSTVGAVKAALNRGRSKLAEQPARIPAIRVRTSDDAALLRLYVERFNRRDWDGLRELIAADARVVVTDRYIGPFADAPYFSTYERMAGSWRLLVGEVDREAVVIIEQKDSQGRIATTAARLRISDGRIAGITDYWYCPWLLPAAESFRTSQSDVSPTGWPP